ncbi:MAG: hypothetical protein J6X94_06485 [Lachnospiraceae bacterium]|nr:hypothetical protein [Lachnospiraceae bacterium]
MNNGIKKVGFTIAMISLIIKGIDLLVFFGSIIEWWGIGIIFYFCLCFTHLVTIKSSRSDNNISVPLSIIMIFVSVLFLLGDILAFLGLAISLNSTPLMAVGITPLCNLLNIAANISILIEGAVNKPVRRYDPAEEYVSYEEIPFSSSDADNEYQEKYGSETFKG